MSSGNTRATSKFEANDSDFELPRQFANRLQLGQLELGAYLRSVLGGHPVHSSETLARAAGFTGIRSRFLAPVYPGDLISVALSLDVASVKKRAHSQSGCYVGGCVLENGRTAIDLEIDLRLVTTGAQVHKID